jgi:hypothetical protein
VIRISFFFGNIARRNGGDPAALDQPRHRDFGDVVADDLEPVLDEVAHHRSAHDPNADDADAPGHHFLPNRLPGQQTAIAHPRQDRQ